MRPAIRVKGLRQLDKRLETMAQASLVHSAIKQTRDELKAHHPRPSLPFVYHVFREKLRDALRSTRK